MQRRFSLNFPRFAAPQYSTFRPLHNSDARPTIEVSPDKPPRRHHHQDRRMPSLEQITISPHLTFDAIVAGSPGAPLVLLLHGFAESMHCWRAQLAALAAAGYRAVAPSQRGYSPGARPDPNDTANYHIDRLMDDAMAIVAACGYGEARFHLVGHDWGGSIAWALADRFPERLASLTVLSRPHPNAFNRALQMR